MDSMVSCLRRLCRFTAAVLTIRPVVNGKSNELGKANGVRGTKKIEDKNKLKMAQISISPENVDAITAPTTETVSIEYSLTKQKPEGGATTGSQNGNRNPALNFLTIYFNFTYYTGCTPFRFSEDKVRRDGQRRWNNNSWYLMKTWKPQQLLCALFHSIGLLRLTLEVRKSTTFSGYPNPEQYFSAVGSIIRILFKALVIKRLWMNRQSFLDIVNFVSVNGSMLPNPTTKLTRKPIVIVYCIICCIMPLIEGFKNYILHPNYFLSLPKNSSFMGNSTWTWWNLPALVSDGRSAFFISREKVLDKYEDISNFDYFLAVLMAAGTLERLLIGFLFDGGLLLGVLTLWSLAHGFAMDLKWDKTSLNINLEKEVGTKIINQNGGCRRLLFPFVCSGNTAVPSSSEKLPFSSSIVNRKVAPSSWSEIYVSYKRIRLLCYLINHAYGGMVTLYVAESILYHSMHLDAVVVSTDLVYRAHLMFFVMTAVGVLIFSADVCHQVESLKIWLSKDESRRNIPLDELNMVLFEINTRVVGVRGSDIFTVTYSLVWNLFTTVVTYFIICVQSGGTRTLPAGFGSSRLM